jgi:hypothetical protein
MVLAMGFSWGWWVPRTTVMLEITSESPQRLAGRFEVDGVVHELSGTVPLKLTFMARTLFYEVAPTEGESDILVSVNTAVDGKASFSCNAKGVKGWMMRGGALWRRGEGIAGMSSTDMERLRR